MTYQITTEADTGSKTRRVRTWTVTAATEDDAMYEARMNHLKVVGWNASTWTTHLVKEN